MMLQEHKPATALLPSGTSQIPVMAGAAVALLLKYLWVLFIGLIDFAPAKSQVFYTWRFTQQ